MSKPSRKQSPEGSTISPCVDRCKIVERTGVCRGCGRTRNEIKGWANASTEQRQQILSELKGRTSLMVEDDEGPSW